MLRLLWCVLLCVTCGPAVAWAQPVPEAQSARIQELQQQLQAAIERITAQDPDPYLLADVAVFAKAVDWAKRFDEFYSPQSADHAIVALEAGLARAAALEQGQSPWDQQAGSLIRGYRSVIDGSVQPYAVKLPPAFAGKELERWPLQINLHGRGDKLNEVAFIHQHSKQSVPEDQTWIQLDVFGRTNNGYRWAGETDVLEALKAVQRRYRIDNRRIVLRGFSMGGAGAWHLGLHYPSLWCSVGPGAGFVDFYKYQKVDQKLPPYQDATLKIYDAIDYVTNAANVPICTYGGELDAQLVASTSMVEAAKAQEIDIKLLIGRGVGHKFHPESEKEFMAFHRDQMNAGRPEWPGRKRIRFVTFTPKYNQCEWLTVEEQVFPYQPSTVEGEITAEGILQLTTKNISVLKIARDVADRVLIDGSSHPLTEAARGLLPHVYFQSTGEGWIVLNYDSSLGFNKNLDFRKRRDLQGPIDDAFMQPFICVRGTGQAWSKTQQDWSTWSLERFQREFAKWMRADIIVVDDTAVTDDMMAQKHLILFGDPGSNRVISRIHSRLPLKWGEKSLTVNGTDYDLESHGVALIYPNPLQPRRYVVINSGHTFHEADFRASNAQLFPRLGDIAILKLERQAGEFTETVEWAELFNASWRLPASK